MLCLTNCAVLLHFWFPELYVDISSLAGNPEISSCFKQSVDFFYKCASTDLSADFQQGPEKVTKHMNM